MSNVEQIVRIEDDDEGPGYPLATVAIRGSAPYSQSHQHGEPMLEGESHDDYDARTWRFKMNTTKLEDGRVSMIIPGFGFQLALAGGARFSKKKIVGHGNSTWTARFASGITVMGDGIVMQPNGSNSWSPVNPANVKPVVLSLNSDGKRGGGKRVPRRLPQIFAPWEATFKVTVLDPMITEDIFLEMAINAGNFIGVGQFRPENGGMNGRFVIKTLNWEDNRRKVDPRVILTRR